MEAKGYSLVVSLQSTTAGEIDAQAIGNEIVASIVEAQQDEMQFGINPMMRHSRTHSRSHSRTGANA